MASPKKNVVVIGGGLTGGALARELSKKLDSSRFNLILINDRPFFVHLIAMARITVTAEDQLEDKALFGFEDLFVNGNGTFKLGKVASIAEGAKGKGGEVVLEDGERIPYASLVLATGVIWPAVIQLPETDADARSHINSWRNRYEKANHVVVVGGGAVGIEIAGELRQTFPKKKVTLVHRESLLLNSAYPDKYRKDIERRVRVRDIDLILGDAVETPPEGTVGITTANGRSLPDVDLVVEAFGSKPNTSYASSLGQGVLTGRGTVKVNEFLEVQGHPGVFAIGDIIEWDEQKQAAKGGTHATIVAANVLSFVQDKPLKKAYKGSPEMILIPLGKSGGSGYLGFLWGIILGDFFTTMLKGKDLLIGRIRSNRGVV